jgi:hypothetical protein
MPFGDFNSGVQVGINNGSISLGGGLSGWYFLRNPNILE